MLHWETGQSVSSEGLALTFAWKIENADCAALYLHSTISPADTS